MSIPEQGFFHCGRCGALFRAAAGAAVIRRCPECGGDPVVVHEPRPDPRLPEGAVARDVAPGPSAPAEGGDADPQHGPVRRMKHRRRRKLSPPLFRLVIILGGWIVLLGTAAVAVKRCEARRVRREESSEAKAARQAGKKAVTGISRDLDERDRVLLSKVFPSCASALNGFLQSAVPEERAQWVLGGAAQMVARMERHAEGPALLLSEELPTPEYVGAIWLADEPLVETMWLARDGCRMEVVFRREQDEWKIDWEEFVRYSAVPWVMFAAGEGEPVQEFRLLVRERLAGSNQYDPALSLVFHVPRFGSPSEPGASSPEFVVARASPQGQKLQALFRMKKEGKVPLGAHAPLRDPEGMIRVRVRIRRDDGGGERRLVLEDVLAGHWLSVTESGIPDGSDLAPDKRKGD